jgi:rhomboid protease GluP
MNEPSDQIAGYYPDTAEDAESAVNTGLAFVGAYRSRSAIEEHGLVLLSIGHPYWVFNVPTASAPFQPFVREAVVPHVQGELKRYDAEALEWQKMITHNPLPTREYRAGVHFAFAYVVVLLIGFRLQLLYPEWEKHLLSNNHALFYNHEWWRPLTALFLHADTGHLLSNLSMGLLFGLLCSKSMGAWLAWALILAGGFAGNILTALSYMPESHQSLGASTAVFAAIGVLTGHGGAETLRDRSRITLFRKSLPLLGGLALLGMYGFGPDPRTDILAHVWGFVCGAVMGLAAGAIQIRKLLAEKCQ